MNGQEIEGYSNIDFETIMKGLLTYPADYNEGTLFVSKMMVVKEYSTGFQVERYLFMNDIIQVVSVLLFH